MLEVEQVSKRFSNRQPPALEDVSFSVRKGAICGLLGHNGAGKSTLLGVMLGMVYPDRGQVTIGDSVVQQEREKALRKVGAIFESPGFYDYLSGWKNLCIFTSLSGKIDRDEMMRAVERVGLESRIHDRISTYSHGMRQRLALAQALLPRPELLLLDEPTDGLDPEGIVEFRERLLQLREEMNLTVLLSSHLLSEVSKLCDQVAIVKHGKLMYSGEVAELSGQRILYRIVAENADDRALTDLLHAGYDGKRIGEGSFSVDRKISAAELLHYLVVEKGIRVSVFTPNSESLESLYLELNAGDE